MTRTGQDAIDYARGRKCENCMPPGYCLKFTREVFDVASLYASAIDAWNGARAPHPGDRNPPAAVPVYFSTPSVYDHVCFFVGPNEVISTFNDDIRSFNGIADIERQFGGSYLGWAEDINGVTVYTGSPDGGDDFLSYLSYEEQRRLLQSADQTLQWGPKQKEDTDRLPHIHATLDQTSANVQNNNNGIHQILDILNGLSFTPTGKGIALAFLVVLIAAVMGVIIGVLVAEQVGAWTGAGVLLLGALFGAVHSILRSR